MPAETWLAADGTAVTIRPMGAADLALEELRRFTNMDPERELAPIATVRARGRERQVGVARYVRGASPERAEIAIALAADPRSATVTHLTLDLGEHMTAGAV